MKKDLQRAAFRLGVWFFMKALVMLGLAWYARKLRREQHRDYSAEAWVERNLRPMTEEELRRSKGLEDR